MIHDSQTKSPLVPEIGQRNLCEAAGCQAYLDLAFSRIREKTALTTRRRKCPLAVQKAFYPEEPKRCHMIILHPPGGIVGGDGLTISVETGNDSQAVVTNDIYTQEDAQFLTQRAALDERRILGVETGGCPHTAIREDASMKLNAVAELEHRFPDLDLIFIESGGDNLSATFSPELADLTIYVIDVAAGDKIPRKG